MPKKNTTDQYIPDTQGRTLTVDLWKALGVLGTAVLVSIVGTAFAVGGMLNSDHFLLAGAVKDIQALEVTSVKQDVYALQQSFIVSQLEEIKKELGEIKSRL